MTHGDKAKAKAGKTSQTSVKKSSSKRAEESSDARGAKAKGNGSAGGKAGKGSVKAGSPKAAAEKGSASDTPTLEVKAKGGGGFSNPAVGDAFRHAVKKYPNAFRKLTD